MFQGRYQAIVCDHDQYLLELIRYIHLNPVRSGMVKEPARYPYSSQKSYLDGKPTEVIDPRKILSLMGGKARYRAFIRDGIKDGHKEAYYEVQDQRFLGDEGFGVQLQDEYEDERPKKRRMLETVVRELSQKVEIGIDELRSADRSWKVSQARTKTGYVLVRRLGYPLSEVARYFHRDPATVSILISRLADRMAKDDGCAGRSSD